MSLGFLWWYLSVVREVSGAGNLPVLWQTRREVSSNHGWCWGRRPLRIPHRSSWYPGRAVEPGWCLEKQKRTLNCCRFVQWVQFRGRKRNKIKKSKTREHLKWACNEPNTWDKHPSMRRRFATKIKSHNMKHGGTIPQGYPYLFLPTEDRVSNVKRHGSAVTETQIQPSHF